MTRLITQTQIEYLHRFGTGLKVQICIEQVSKLYCELTYPGPAQTFLFTALAS